MRAAPGAPRAIAIVGGTATGKTALAVDVARRLDGVVISLDSRQAYRGVEVGTAAPGAAELAAVPHRGVAFLDPDEPYGAGRFARLARSWIAGAEREGRVPVLAGGSGLFLEALLRPVFREPEMDRRRRRRLRRFLDERPAEEVLRGARRLDPALFRRLERVDRQRAARTLELALLSGRPLTWWQDHGEPEAPPVHARVYHLELPPAEQRARIRGRAERLLEEGWVEEARALLERGLSEGPAASAIGMKAVFALVRGEIDREEAVARVEADTWAYARRQRTWFRHRLPEDAVRLDAREPTGQLARRVVEEWGAGAEPGEDA